MTNHLQSLVKDGFSLPRNDGRRYDIRDLALLSLRIALKAFSRTYLCMKRSIHAFDPASNLPDDVMDSHGLEYSEAAAETIVHFQHFAELVCKEILRQKHELIATDASSDPVVLDKLLSGEPLTADEEGKPKSIEFSATLHRIDALLKAHRLDASKYSFLLKYRPFLEQLNTLRNRTWHRGRFILRYPALDQLITQYALPFTSAVLALPDYVGTERIWKHYPLASGIEPLKILEESEGAPYNVGKIAFFKELTRAAYENEIRGTGASGQLKSITDHFDRRVIRRAVAVAESETESEHADIHTCPVCGLNTLLAFYSTEAEGFDAHEGTYDNVWHYTYEVLCVQCSFSIDCHLDNPRVYGVNIPNFWTGNK
jgi:hypothetical protein